MPPTRRDALRGLGGALSTLALAGCLSDDSPADSSSSPSATGTTTTTPTPSTAPDATTTTGTDRTRVHADQQVSYDHVVRLDNGHGESRRVSLHVEADDGSVVHEETYDLDPYGGREAFDFATLASDEIRAFTVRATHDGQSEEATIRTSECYGNVLVTLSPEDGFGVTYSVC